MTTIYVAIVNGDATYTDENYRSAKSYVWAMNGGGNCASIVATQHASQCPDCREWIPDMAYLSPSVLPHPSLHADDCTHRADTDAARARRLSDLAGEFIF